MNYSPIYPLSYYLALVSGISTVALAVRNALGLPPNDENEQTFYREVNEKFKAEGRHWPRLEGKNDG